MITLLSHLFHGGLNYGSDHRYESGTYAGT